MTAWTSSAISIGVWWGVWGLYGFWWGILYGLFWEFILGFKLAAWLLA